MPQVCCSLEGSDLSVWERELVARSLKLGLMRFARSLPAGQVS